MKFEDGHTVGIDLGTSYSSIARLDDDGEPVILENSQGRPITPSILILGDDGRVVVGPSPELVAEEDPERVVLGIKRHMGDTKFELYHERRRLTPELISSMILTKLRQDAEEHLKPIRNAVITVPYYFNEPKRQATRHAGRIAGLNVVDIINEPTAATLAYAWQKGELGNADLPNKERTILVYDLGGGTFDVTVVRYTPTEFAVVGTDGDTMLGGLDWTDRMVQYVAEQFESKFGLDPRGDAQASKALMVESEAAKSNSVKLASGIPKGSREYMLYLPLYNGVESVEIGIPRGTSIWKPKARPSGLKPIVFYGTSITQGGCASRPGMVHTAILGRWLDAPVVNLGFSGNGRMEAEVATLMADIDASIFVIDCLPNISAGDVTSRTEPLVKILRKAHPTTPIVLVEDRSYTDSFLLASKRERNLTSRVALKAVFERLKKFGDSNLYYISGEDLIGDDGEGTVDSSHPTDLGFLRQSEAFMKVLRPILEGQNQR